MNYKFNEVRLDLQREEVSIMVAFQENPNRWKIKEYKFDAKQEEINIDDLLRQTKKIIENE